MIKIVLLTVVLLVLSFSTVYAQAPDGETYTVQAGDWLSKLAEKYYGDPLAYPVIVEATNAKAVEDDGFIVITNPDVIEVGQEIWIPISLEGAAAPPPTTGGDQLTETQLKNATYSGIYDEPVTLTDGVYQGEPFVEGGASRSTVGFVDDLVAYGDLNGGGVEDAAVLLVESSGGSGTFTYLAAALDQDGQPVIAGTALVGDRTQIKSMVIENGRIRMDVITQGPDDPMCCPTQKVRNVYEVRDEGLVEVSSEAQGTVSLDDLMSTAWVLTEVAQDLIIDMLPTLAGTQITASFAGGQVSGSTGCNDYTAPVSSDGDQSLAIGPASTTQRACTELLMNQETEYLAALGNTFQWSYWAGRLALTYQTEDGSIGTLIFVLAPAEQAGMVEPSVSARAAAATEPDSALETTLYDFIGSEYTTALFPDGTSWVRYHYNRVDLNDDGIDESLVLLIGSLFL